MTSFPRPLVFESLFAGGAGVSPELASTGGSGFRGSAVPGCDPESSEERSRDTRVVYFDLNLSPDSRIDVQMLDVEVVGKQLFAGFVAGIVKKQTNKPSWPFTCEDWADSHV